MVTLADIVSALADCLEVLEEGGDELEARLRKHERYRQELVALLGIVQDLRTTGQEEELHPSDEFLGDLKARLLRQLPSTPQRGGDEG
jgi:hypothetical protein